MKNKTRFCSLILGVFILCACGDNSTSVIEGTGGGTNLPGQGILGPVVGAQVAVYSIHDIEGEPLCETTTLQSTILEEAGTFTIPNKCIEGSGLYLVKLSGGNDIDVNDDGVIDVEATPVEGVFRVLITGEQITRLDWKVSSLTESIVQSLLFLLSTDTSTNTILNTIDRLAPLYLDDDLNEDGVINGLDILLWHPRLNRTSPTNSMILQVLNSAIHEGTNTTVVDSNPGDSNKRYVDTLSPARTVEVVDGIAYVGTPTALQIIDTRDPVDTKIISSIPSGFITDMAIANKRAYIALGKAGFQVFDISTVEKPSFLSTQDQYPVNYLSVDGNTLITLSIEDSDLLILRTYHTDNLAEPLSKLVVDQIEPGEIYRFSYSHGHAYISTGPGATEDSYGEQVPEAVRITAVDTFDPDRPTISHRINTTGRGSIKATEHYLIHDEAVMFDQPIIRILNHSGEPVASATTNCFFADVSTLQVGDDLMIGSCKGTIEIWDVKTFALITEVDLYVATKSSSRSYWQDYIDQQSNNGYMLGRVSNIFVDDETVYVANNERGLQIFDLSGVKGATNYRGSVNLGEPAFVNVGESSLLVDEYAVIADGAAISGATISIHRVSDLNSEPLCELTSSYPSETAVGGQINIPGSCIPEIGFYLLTVTAGYVADDSAQTQTEFNGTLHAVISAQDLNSQTKPWQVNIYTEYLYQKVKETLGQEVDEKALQKALNYQNDVITDQEQVLLQELADAISAGEVIDTSKNKLFNVANYLTDIDLGIASIGSTDNFLFSSYMSSINTIHFDKRDPNDFSVIDSLSVTVPIPTFIGDRMYSKKVGSDLVQVYDISAFSEPVLLGEVDIEFNKTIRADAEHAYMLSKSYLSRIDVDENAVSASNLREISSTLFSANMGIAVKDGVAYVLRAEVLYDAESTSIEESFDAHLLFWGFDMVPEEMPTDILSYTVDSSDEPEDHAAIMLLPEGVLSDKDKQPFAYLGSDIFDQPYNKYDLRAAFLAHYRGSRTSFGTPWFLGQTRFTAVDIIDLKAAEADFTEKELTRQYPGEGLVPTDVTEEAFELSSQQEKERMSTKGGIRSIVVRMNYLFVESHHSIRDPKHISETRVDIYDISEALNPIFVTRLNKEVAHPGLLSANLQFLNKNLACATGYKTYNGKEGLFFWVLDVSDISNVSLVQEIEMPTLPMPMSMHRNYRLVISEGRALLSAGYSGKLYIIDLDEYLTDIQ